MAVTIEQTPNPNALKFSVGVDVGGPKTFVAGGEVNDPLAASLLSLDGVASIFMTADFVTISKLPDRSWDDIALEAQRILDEHFAG